MRQLVALVLVSTGLALGTGAHPASACSCTEADAETRFAEADVVFTGTFEETTPDGDQRIAHGFTVDRVFKGETPIATVVTSADDTAACGTEFVAARYLVYAQRSADGGGLTTGLCSGNIRLTGDSGLPEGLGAGAEPDADDTAVAAGRDATARTGEGGVGVRGLRPLPVALAGAVVAVTMLGVSLRRQRRRR